MTTALGRLFQCPTTIWVKNLLVANLNLPRHNSRPFPLVLSLVTTKRQVCAPSFPHERVVAAVRTPLSLLQAEQTKCPQPLLMWLPLKALHILVALLWMIPNSFISCILWHPTQHRALKVRLPQCRAQWDNPLPCPTP